MKLRPPSDAEWAVLRMLLPETFQDVDARQYIVCAREGTLSDGAPRIAGAMSFRQEGDRLTGLRVHVVPHFRRRGVGSSMVESLLQRGARLIEGIADIRKEPGANEFAERNCFARINGLTTVEGEMDAMRQHLARLRARHGDGDLQMLPLPQAPVAEVARLHADYVAAESDWGQASPWRAVVAQSPELLLSPVAMLDGRVVGMMLGSLEGSTAVVQSLAVVPEHRGGRAALALLSEALNIGWAHGARRARFSYDDTNVFTRRLAERFEAKVIGESVKFRSELPLYIENHAVEKYGKRKET